MANKKDNIVAIVVTLVFIIAMAVGTIFFVRAKHKKTEEETTTATAETTTVFESTTEPEGLYFVDKDDVDACVKAQKFTFAYEDLKADSFPTSSNESKTAYWRGFVYEKNGKTYVNPLVIASNSVGFGIDKNVVPSDYYDAESSAREVPLNARGIKDLEALREKVFSPEVDIHTDSVAKNSTSLYNSTPSVSSGVVYSQKIGITKGNLACWVVEKHKSVDEVFSEMEKANADEATTSAGAVKSGESATSATADAGKTLVFQQLVRCGNTVTPTPPTPTEPTTTPPTKPSTTTPPVVTTRPTPTTKPSTTRPNWTLPTLTTKPVTTTLKKDPAKDPVNQGNAQRGGGTYNPTEKATSAVQPNKPTKATTVRTVETTTRAPSTTRKEETTTRPSTTRESTTRAPSTTKAPTTRPTAVATQKPSSGYTDNNGNTTVITPSEVFSGRPVLPD